VNSEGRRLHLETIEAHTGGEPLRVVLAGFPDLPGATILERRRHARGHCDGLRRALMLEPRGHADMYGAVPVPPASADGDLGVLFMHNEGWSTMCGHGVIALVKVAIEEGLVDVAGRGPRPEVRLDTPAGRVTATAELLADGSVGTVSFVNVPSFVLAAEVVLGIAGIGKVRADLAFGGAFYAYVEAADLGLELVPERCAEIVELGRAVKAAAVEAVRIVHPSGEADLEFVYGAILVDRARVPGRHSRNVCVFADGEVDRSPTGTGVAGRAAIHHARGELGVGDWITIESLVGSTMDVRVLREATLAGGRRAVVPEVRGRARVLGRARWSIDPDDELGAGFLLR
jgi:trans-L-3-hydroxyproline dehydratase